MENEMTTEETMQSDHLSICQEANRQLRMAIEELRVALQLYRGLINHQYTGSKEAMTALQVADDYASEILAKGKP